MEFQFFVEKAYSLETLPGVMEPGVESGASGAQAAAVDELLAAARANIDGGSMEDAAPPEVAETSALQEEFERVEEEDAVPTVVPRLAVLSVLDPMVSDRKDERYMSVKLMKEEMLLRGLANVPKQDNRMPHANRLMRFWNVMGNFWPMQLLPESP